MCSGNVLNLHILSIKDIVTKNKTGYQNHRDYPEARDIMKRYHKEYFITIMTLKMYLASSLHISIYILPPLVDTI